MLTLGKTFSPALYAFRVSSFSCSVLDLPGFAWRYNSSRVVTFAFGLASRTDARHEGHVKGLSVLLDAWEACHENHSFKHEPQKV